MAREQVRECALEALASVGATELELARWKEIDADGKACVAIANRRISEGESSVCIDWSDDWATNVARFTERFKPLRTERQLFSSASGGRHEQ
jgi:hypothetical protein